MRKKPTPFLDIYHLWMKTGKIGIMGMPLNLRIDYNYQLFVPKTDDEIEFTKEQWKTTKNKFTPIRQTVILLTAAMNNEL